MGGGWPGIGHQRCAQDGKQGEKQDNLLHDSSSSAHEIPFSSYELGVSLYRIAVIKRSSQYYCHVSARARAGPLARDKRHAEGGGPHHFRFETEGSESEALGGCERLEADRP